MTCSKCGHIKSDHENEGCVIAGCGCRNFRFKKKLEQGKLDDTVNAIRGFNIDTRKLFSKYDKPAEKSDETVARRSDVKDSVTQTFTEISQLGRDYQEKIIEYEKIIADESGKYNEDDRIESWIKLGICLRKDNRASESLRCFRYVLLKDEKNILALKHRGYSLKALGKFHDAIEEFQKIMDIDGVDVHYLNEIAICYADRKVAEYDVAISYLARVLDIDKKNKLAYNNMGYCYERKKEYPAALKAFKKSGEYYAQRHMVYCYWQVGKDDDALEIGEKLIKDKEADDETYYIVGYVLAFTQKKYDQAIPLLKESLRLDERPNRYSSLGLCYLRKKRYDLGILYYKKYFEVSNSRSNAIERSNLGMCYMNIGQHKNAQKWFEDALKTDPKHVNAFWGLLTSLQNNGQNDILVKKYEEYVSNDPKFSDDEGVLRIMIECQYDLGQYNDALEFSNKLLNLNRDSKIDKILPKIDGKRPSSDYTWRGFIFSHLQPRRYEDAYKCFENALKIDPKWSETYQFWGIALFEDHKYPEAKEKFQKAYELSKSDEDLLWKGRAIKKIGWSSKDDSITKEAEEIFDSLLESTGYGGQAMLEKGNCNWNLNKKNIAEDCWLKACKIIPDNTDVWCGLGDVSKSSHDALIFYEEALRCDKNNAVAHHGKGGAYRNLKKWSDAIECYDRAIELDDNFEQAFYFKGVALGNAEKYTDQINWYADFIEKFPKSDWVEDAWSSTAWAQNAIKKYADARDSCNIAFKILKNRKATRKPDAGPFTKAEKKELKEELEFLYQERGCALEGLEQYGDAIKDYKKLRPTKNPKWTFPLTRIIYCLGQLGRINDQKEYRKKRRDFDPDDDDDFPVGS